MLYYRAQLSRWKELAQLRFPALQSRDFRLLWLGQGVSIFGSQMQLTALNWQLYELTHPPIALGLFGLSRVIPIVLFSLIGGAVADAKDRRRVMLVTQTLLTLCALSLWILTLTKHISPGMIYALTAAAAAATAFDNPSRQSLIPNLVPREHFANAASLNSMIFQTGTILGPATAGLLIARHHLGTTYLLNAISFLAVLTALLFIRPRYAEARTEATPISLESIKGGLRFVQNTPILYWTILLDFLATFFSSASALLPIFARDILKIGGVGYGLLSAAPAVGSLLTSAIVSSLPPIRNQGKTVINAVMVYGAATIVFGLVPNAIVCGLALAATGAADTVSTILRQTIRQLVTPDHLRGRSTAINMIFFMGGPQLGELEAGLVAAWLGAQASVVTGGLGCLLAAAWVAYRAHALREYRYVEGETVAR